MSIFKNYYVIAGYDLTKHKTDKYEDWKWTDEGEQYICNQSNGNIQLFNDPMNGDHLYLGYVLASGDQYYFETTKIDLEVFNKVSCVVYHKLIDLIELGVVDSFNGTYPEYSIIAFEECS